MCFDDGRNSRIAFGKAQKIPFTPFFRFRHTSMPEPETKVSAAIDGRLIIEKYG